MISENTPENDHATIATRINTPIFQNMPLTNEGINQQIHIQTQVEGCERKDAMSMKVIDETKLRIYFPKNPDAITPTPVISACASSSHSAATKCTFQEEFVNTQGPP